MALMTERLGLPAWMEETIRSWVCAPSLVALSTCSKQLAPGAAIETGRQGSVGSATLTARGQERVYEGVSGYGP